MCHRAAWYKVLRASTFRGSPVRRNSIPGHRCNNSLQIGRFYMEALAASTLQGSPVERNGTLPQIGRSHGLSRVSTGTLRRSPVEQNIFCGLISYSGFLAVFCDSTLRRLLVYFIIISFPCI